jgi:hypothetical protein
VKEPVGPAGLGETKVEPADLPGGIPPYRGAQRPRDQLRSQADAKGGLAPRDCLADQLHFGIQVGQIVVYGHGAAEEDQGVIRGDVRCRGARFVEIGIVHLDMALAKHWSNQTQAFEGNVAEGQHTH